MSHSKIGFASDALTAECGDAGAYIATALPSSDAGRTEAVERLGLAAVGAVGLLAGGGGAVLVATSDHLLRPRAYAFQIAVIVIGMTAAGFLWRLRRPGNRIAWGLFASAAAAGGISLQGAENPLLHSIGVLFDAPVFILGYYVIFAFPQGRLTGVVERLLLGAIAAVLLLAFLPWFFLSPSVSGGAPLAACNAACPENALMIANRPNLAAGAGDAEEYCAVAISIAILITLFYRFAAASRLRRRALIMVYLPALALTVAFGTFRAANVGLVEIDASAADNLGWVLTVARSALPYGFLLALVQASLLAGVALKKTAIRLEASPDVARLRALLADSLRDSSLELCVIGPGQSGFVDSTGHPIDPSRLGPGRSSTTVEGNGVPVALIVHDPALDSDPELVRAAGHAVVLALEKGRLETVLHSRNTELRDSRARIQAAADTERQRIERDLHDGAQQRLVALRIRLNLAADLMPNDPRSGARILRELVVEAEEALEDIRSLAGGVYPSLLADEGIPDALRALARRAPLPTEVESAALRRYPPEIESAVYFICLEALQNAEKHAAGATFVQVSVHDDGALRFQVRDNGAGFVSDEVSAGAGFTNMRDRVAAVGGELSIRSEPGAGTVVAGAIPLPA
jgi:signal transduction histidine kinase